jgi:hypothetical protein
MKNFIVLNEDSQSGAFIESESLQHLRDNLVEDSFTGIIEVESFDSIDMYNDYNVFEVSCFEFLLA